MRRRYKWIVRQFCKPRVHTHTHTQYDTNKIFISTLSGPILTKCWTPKTFTTTCWRSFTVLVFVVFLSLSLSVPTFVCMIITVLCRLSLRFVCDLCISNTEQMGCLCFDCRYTPLTQNTRAHYTKYQQPLVGGSISLYEIYCRVIMWIRV